MADDSIDYGNGYDSWLVPIQVTDDGNVYAQGYADGAADQTSGSDGIGVPIPADTEEVDWNPLIPRVAPPTARYSFVTYGLYNVLFVNESLGNTESLQWDFGDGNTSTEYNPMHSYSGAGTFDVSLVVRNEGGEDYHWETIVTVNPAPIVAFDFAIGGYAVYLTNTSNTAEYLWDFGDGNTSTARDPKHLYAGTGDYVITLTSEGVKVEKTVKIDVEILLTWDDNADDEDGFKIERSPDGSTGWVEIADITNPNIESYGVTKAKDGIDSAEMNFFRVYAYNGAGDSGYSNISSVRCS